MKLQSVRIIQSHRKYQKLFEALYFLDSITSGVMFQDGMKIDKRSIRLIKNMLEQDTPSLSNDPYIESMVRSYIRNKKQFIIEMSGLKVIEKAILGIVFDYRLKSSDTWRDSWNPQSLWTSRSNLILPGIMSLFPNIMDITINTRSGEGSFPFNMVHFLDIITPLTNFESIKIQEGMRGKNMEHKSWIKKLWTVSKRDLIRRYSRRKLKISFNQEVVNVHTQNEWFSFEFFRILRV